MSHHHVRLRYITQATHKFFNVDVEIDILFPDNRTLTAMCLPDGIMDICTSTIRYTMYAIFQLYHVELSISSIVFD